MLRDGWSRLAVRSAPGFSRTQFIVFHRVHSLFILCVFFFFNDTATTEIYTLSLHDALPIYDDIEDLIDQVPIGDGEGPGNLDSASRFGFEFEGRSEEHTSELQSPVPISYAVFCLKKKKKNKKIQNRIATFICLVTLSHHATHSQLQALHVSSY